jgi:hypothetical protein
MKLTLELSNDEFLTNVFMNGVFMKDVFMNVCSYV